MLFLAQADNGLVLPARAPVDLRTELEALFGFYEALADEQGVTLVLEGSGTVGGDALMIRRALGNLLANAIRHAPRDATVQARLGTRSDGGVTLVLQNPGSITAEHLLHLFDRFYRVDASRQAASEGAGLGLAITQSIVAAHGAAIRAESDCGEVRFTVDWPPPGAPAATPTSERSPGTTNDARLANRRSPT